MEDISPPLSPQLVEEVDGATLSTNLFKHHPLPPVTGERLRTYLRIRPINSSANDGSCYKVANSTTLIAYPPESSSTFKNEIREEIKSRKFTFSQIFDVEAGQQEIYDNCARPLVKRFIDGDNCLLFVYGITSSGKSYTMQGSPNCPGIIPRALKSIFELVGDRIVRKPIWRPNKFCEAKIMTSQELAFEKELAEFIVNNGSENIDKKLLHSMTSFMTDDSVTCLNDSQFKDLDLSKYRYSVWVNFVEFYNENIKDLLAVDVKDERPNKLILLPDENQNCFIKGLRNVMVTSAEEAYRVLLYGQNNLHISSTLLNKHSSRSHCAFNIKLIKLNEATHQAISVNNISFCDLAGSERSSKTNNVGDRLREAGKINASLLALSRCITAIRHNQRFKNRQRPVPFRDSKLTSILKPFLSGSGISNMIANINPSPSMFDETLVALNFSAIASQVVVSDEENKKKLHETLKRLTQLWMQSTQRWSSFAHLKPPVKPSFPSISAINAFNEEEEDDESENVANLTCEEINRKVDEITKLDFDEVNAQEIEILKNQIDYLNGKLEQALNEKLDVEMDVRKQVAAEFLKLKNDMEELVENKDLAKRQIERNMEEKLKNQKDLFKVEKTKYEKRIKELALENFTQQEKFCEKESELIEKIEKKSKEIDELKKEIESLKNKSLNTPNIIVTDVSQPNQMVDVLQCHQKTDTIYCDAATTTAAVCQQDKAIDNRNSLVFAGRSDACVGNDLCFEVKQTQTEIQTFKDESIMTETILTSDQNVACDCVDFNLILKEKCTSDEKEVQTENLCIESSASNDLEKELNEYKEANKQLKEKLESESARSELRQNTIQCREDRIVQLDKEVKELKEKNEALQKGTAKSFSCLDSLRSTGHSINSKLSDTQSILMLPEESSDLRIKRKHTTSSRIEPSNANYFSQFKEENESSDYSLSQSTNKSEKSEKADDIGGQVFSTHKGLGNKKKGKKRPVEVKDKDDDDQKSKSHSKKKKIVQSRMLNSISPINPIEENQQKTSRVTRSRAKKNLTFEMNE